MEQKVLTKIEPVKLPWKVKILYCMGEFSKTTTVIMLMAFGCKHALQGVCNGNPYNFTGCSQLRHHERKGKNDGARK